jgi:4-hydroxy-tetrahydrodipicolinate synthase
VISVVANLVPKDNAEMVKAWEEGHLDRARQLFYKLLHLCQAMFIETNPVPVKTSLALLEKIDGEMRLPLCPMAPANLDKLKSTLLIYGKPPTRGWQLLL